MGQYYITCNTNKAQYLNPHRFGEGLKLLEFGYSSEGTLTALAILLADGNNRGGGDLRSDNPVIGSWAGDRIVVAGDYADNGNFLPPEWFHLPIEDRSRLEKKHSKAVVAGDVFKAGSPPNLYHLARLCFRDISASVIEALRADGYSKYSPNERNFLESTVWVISQTTNESKDRDFGFLTPEAAGRAMLVAAQRGQAYFDPYVKWLLEQKLPTDTADLLSRVTWADDGCGGIYRVTSGKA